MAEQAVKSGFYRAVGLFFEYDTPKIVHIRSKKVGVINRLIQLAIFGYIIGYVIVWEKGYQEFDDVVSASTTKVKGVAYTNKSLHVPDISGRIWDVADYVVPPQENDAFFVMTNVIITRGQTQDKCDEDPNMLNIKCTSDDDCTEGEPVVNGNGVRTGKCVLSTQNSTVHVCQIYAWCPVEVDELPIPGKALLEDSRRFTVLLKNNIEFPKFGAKRRNILETQNSTYLQSCHYNSKDDDGRLCPIFVLEDIVHEADENYTEMAVNGGVMSINIHWDCDLDYSIDRCKPHYTFSRLDNREAKIAKGWNFRYANYYYNGTVETRDLIKAYGIRYVIRVTGQAGKFSIVPLLLNIGSGLALLAIATVLCDIVVLYVLKKREFYKQKKYLFVTGDDAFRALEEEYSDDERETSVNETRQRQKAQNGNNPSYNTFTTQEKDPSSTSVSRRNGASAEHSGDFSQQEVK